MGTGQALVFLSAAVVAVPVAKRLGLGSVLGYLLAGVAIGPAAMNLLSEDPEAVMHAAEFGVVMMLFLIGLELKPSLLWRMRRSILGLGGVQVVASTAAIAGVALAFGVETNAAIAVGLMLALSSTAIVLQTQDERGVKDTPVGKASFSVLLFQDIAVIPILAIYPLLGHASMGADDDSWLAGQEWYGGIVVGVIAGIVLLGRFVFQPLFRFIAREHLREVFIAAALLLVIGAAALMERCGLSPALGTFLAGVVLADSEFRHEIESNLEPFKGLLLGLPFLAVGASIDLAAIVERPLLMAGLVLLLLGVKAAVLFVLGLTSRMARNDRLSFTLALCSGGEFAFVLANFGNGVGVFDPELSELMVATVTLSMFVAPLLFLIDERFVQTCAESEEGGPEQEMPTTRGKIVVAGFSGFGRTVTRFLRAEGVDVVVLDLDPDRVQILRRFGLEVYFGDACRQDLLEAAGAGDAKMFIIAIGKEERSLAVLDTVRRNFPNLPVLARARNLSHAHALLKAGAAEVTFEAGESSMAMGKEVLQRLGWRKHTAHRAALRFRNHDRETIASVIETWDDREAAAALFQVRNASLADLLNRDRATWIDDVDHGWDVPPADVRG
ncbi:MAG: monovalent cation:proton antiporter-2 (CPA2) family protein [Planctomycetota bacterium]|jgi:monovalent cation:proton antiporter-2 (CPA2) family protein